MTTKVHGTWRQHWRSRLRHPSWWPGLIRKDFRSWCSWLEQGRPRDVPVVVSPGRLVVDPMGRSLITGWHFDLNYMDRGVLSVDDLWDRLTAQYPVERTEEFL